MSTEPITLPDLSDERVEAIERDLFDAIAADRERLGREKDAAARRARTRRGRFWLAGGAAAAVIVVAAVIAPQLTGVTPSSGGLAEEAVAPASQFGGGDSAVTDQALTEEQIRSLEGVTIDGAAADGTGAAPGADREIIATASASVTVDDVAEAARTIGESAEAAGGYVEALSVGGSGEVLPGVAVDDPSWTSAPRSSAWITVRVPADQLVDVTASLAEVGEVTSERIDRRDVTAQTVDLQARVDALTASVTRLEQLMAEAATTADLLAAESELSERQAELESYRQQLESLGDQVALSTLTVTLSQPADPVTADPAGFGDGLAAGWNGLVATVNGIVVALGFLLPWLVVVGIAVTLVWLVVRAVRRRRDAGSD